MPAVDRTIMVWMVEDDLNYRETVLAVFRETPTVECGRVFGGCDEVVTLLNGPGFAGNSERLPDVLLLDVNLPGQSGIEGIPLFKEALPETRIVMLTIRDEAETIFEAFRRGASGYLPKNAPIEEMLDAIHEANRGGTLMPASVARKVLATLQKAPRVDHDLSSREIDVLKEMVTGKSQKQIADSLFISPHTVNTHIQHIYEKLHVHSGIQAVAKALRDRII